MSSGAELGYRATAVKLKTAIGFSYSAGVDSNSDGDVARFGVPHSRKEPFLGK